MPKTRSMGKKVEEAQMEIGNGMVLTPAQEQALKDMIGWDQLRLTPREKSEILSKPEVADILKRHLEQIRLAQAEKMESEWKSLRETKLEVEGQRMFINQRIDVFREEWKRATEEKLHFVCLKNFKKQIWFKNKGYALKMDELEKTNKKELSEAAKRHGETVEKFNKLNDDLNKEIEREKRLLARLATYEAEVRTPEEDCNNTELVPVPEEDCNMDTTECVPPPPAVEEDDDEYDDSLAMGCITLSDSEDESDNEQEPDDSSCYFSETEEEVVFNRDYFIDLCVE